MVYKEQYPNHLVMLKVGNFYELYNIDAYIISNIMHYNLKNINDVVRAGFPIVSFNKVIENLNKLKINYLVIEKEDVYKVKIKKNFKVNNYLNYSENYEQEEIINKRIDNIYNYLKNYNRDNIFELLTKIESIYER